MTKPIAKGVNHLAKTARQPAGAAATGRNVRCLSHGSNTSEKASRPAPTTATMANSNGQRVVRMRSLRMFVTVWKPISGRNRAKASRAVKPASRSARAISTRWFGAPSAISHLLDIRPAEQALRQEDQCDGEHGKLRLRVGTRAAYRRTRCIGMGQRWRAGNTFDYESA